MKVKYNNYYRMLLAVEKFLLANTSITGLIPAFGRAITRLTNKIAEIDAAEKAKGGRATGLFEAKNELEEKLISSIMKVASAIKTYSSENNLTDLFKIVDFKRWGLVKLKDNDLAIKGGYIKKLADDKISELEEYGITAADLTELETLSNGYTAFIGNMGNVRGGKIVITKNVGVLFDEAKTIIEDQLDGFVETLKGNHSDFYTQYRAVREVLDYGGSHPKDDEEETPPPPDTPIPPAQ